REPPRGGHSGPLPVADVGIIPQGQRCEAAARQGSGHSTSFTVKAALLERQRCVSPTSSNKIRLPNGSACALCLTLLNSRHLTRALRWAGSGHIQNQISRAELTPSARRMVDRCDRSLVHAGTLLILKAQASHCGLLQQSLS